MKIVLAPDSFKECLSAREVCTALEEGLLTAIPDAEILSLPMADGGEGSLTVLQSALDLTLHEISVRDPLGRTVQATFGYSAEKRVAVIEMASASGLELIPPNERRALNASSYGTGELLRRALDLGCLEIVLFIGGSATSDGGSGAIGRYHARFTPGPGGGDDGGD